MDSWTRTYLGSLFVVLTLIGVVPAQDSLVDESLDLTDVIVDVENEAAQAADVGSDASAELVRVVRLKSDGKLEGRISIIQPTGKRLPANAQVKFQRDGQLVEEAVTDKDGQFEVQGIDPGSYTATASIDAGSTDFTVSVLPFDANAGPDQMILDATLTPTPELYVEDSIGSACTNCGEVIDGVYTDGGYIDGGIVDGGMVCDSCMGGEIIGEEIVSMGAPCGSTCGGFSGGGGCCGGGGGRGLGWALGAAGLATGIAALAIDDDDNNNTASPSRP